jgi:hypothetical protein
MGEKRSVLVCSFLILFFAAATTSPGQIIENPAKPKAVNAGRIVTPKEILSIEDSGEKYYFKYPYGLKTGPDGSIFLLDESQFLWFDKDGRFLRNLFKKGQGPGEMMWAGGYDCSLGGVVVLSQNPTKLLWFDAAGKHLKDATLQSKDRLLSFQGRIGSRLIFETHDFPSGKGEPAYVDLPYGLIVWDEQKNDWTTLSSFPVLVYAISSNGRAAGLFDIGNFHSVPLENRFLVISHTTEYAVKIFDVESNKVEREFRRAYTRVPPPLLKPGQNRGSIILNGKTYEAPEQKFANDISNLFVRGGLLWVVTSTIEKKKGVLIDVFDRQGSYRDSFYLNLPESALTAVHSSTMSTLAGNTLLTIEKNEDETFAVKKYRIDE